MSNPRERRQVQATTVGLFVRGYFVAFGIAALIGLVIGIIWVVAGLLHFHPLW